MVVTHLNLHLALSAHLGHDQMPDNIYLTCLLSGTNDCRKLHFKNRQDKNPQIRSKVVKQTKKCQKRDSRREETAASHIISMLTLTSVKMQTIINHPFMKTKHQTPKCPLETNTFLISIKSSDNSLMFFCEQLLAHSTSALQGSPTALCLSLPSNPTATQHCWQQDIRKRSWRV